MPRPRSSGRYSRSPSNQIRRNERIRAREVRLIDPEGKQLGVVDTNKALEVARQLGLDLVEISPNARPPVCRILDFGKYMYEQSKKSKDKQSTTSKIKEVKFRVRIEQHDYMTKLRRAEEFLYKGNKVKMTLMFRGREMEHQQLGVDVLNRAVEDLVHVGVAEGQPRLNGRFANLVMSPLPTNKRKLKYNELHVVESRGDEDLDEDDED